MNCNTDRYKTFRNRMSRSSLVNASIWASVKIASSRSIFCPYVDPVTRRPTYIFGLSELNNTHTAEEIIEKKCIFIRENWTIKHPSIFEIQYNPFQE